MHHKTPAVELLELEQWYTATVNIAVSQDRYDVVDELTAEFEVQTRELRAAA